MIYASASVVSLTLPSTPQLQMKIGEDGCGGAGENMESLLNAIRRLHEREMDRGRRARVLSVEVRAVS